MGAQDTASWSPVSVTLTVDDTFSEGIHDTIRLSFYGVPIHKSGSVWVEGPGEPTHVVVERTRRKYPGLAEAQSARGQVKAHRMKTKAVGIAGTQAWRGKSPPARIEFVDVDEQTNRLKGRRGASGRRATGQPLARSCVSTDEKAPAELGGLLRDGSRFLFTWP